MDDLLNGGSPSVLRGLNLRSTLRYVRTEGPVSKADLIRLTGLSRPTINDVVNDLLASNLILTGEADHPRSGVGTNRVFYSFNAMRGLLLGVDIGSRTTVIYLADLSGNVLGRARITLETQNDNPFGVTVVRREIARLLEEQGTDTSSLVYATVCTPGVVDPDTGRLTLAPQIPTLNGVEIAGVLGVSCPTSVENEMRAALLGEHWKGAAKGNGDVVYVGVGAGIGAAFMFQGLLYPGHSSAAGEIGYLNPGGALSYVTPGEMGPLEEKAGAAAFAARGAAAIEQHPESLLASLTSGGNSVTPDLIRRAAELGDNIALSLMEEEAELLAQALATISIVLDPEIVVIGGGVAQAGAVLINPLREKLHQIVPGKPPKIVPGSLGDESAAAGAIRLAIAGSDSTIEEELRGVK